MVSTIWFFCQQNLRWSLGWPLYDLLIDLLWSSVARYDPEKGLIYLYEPRYDGSSHARDDIQIVAGVEISLVNVKAEQLEVGNWMNVIGYIDTPRYKPLTNGDKKVQGIRIRAQSIWDTGTLDARIYFESLTARRKAFD